SIEKNELDSLSVRVANPASYRDAKVEYQSILSRLKLTVEKRSSGPVLKITSTQSVSDPFLDLLLEVSWAAGRLTREYTFLLDPPEFGRKNVAQALEPAAPVQGQSLPASAPPARTAAPAAPAEGAGTYGPVKQGETLGRIASKVKPEGVTLDQMLIALYQANKSAFVGSNIHRLRSGQVLSVPGKDDAAAIANADAMKLVRVQTADWRAYLDRVAASAPATAGESGASSAGKVSTLAEDKGPAADTGADKLRLSKTKLSRGAAGAIAAKEDATAS